jgi:hypothetical protein
MYMPLEMAECPKKNKNKKWLNVRYQNSNVCGNLRVTTIGIFMG